MKISKWSKKHSDSEGYCIVFESVFKVNNALQSVTQHVGTKKHITNSSKISPLQLRLAPKVVASDGTQPGTSGIEYKKKSLEQAQLYSVSETASRAELTWAMKNVVCNMSAASCEGIRDTFEAIFPNCVPQGFSLSKTKLSYLVTEALGPYFHDKIIRDVQAAYYSILYNETTRNSENEKELQVAIRCWSKTNSEILKSFFLDHATADEL